MNLFKTGRAASASLVTFGADPYGEWDL